MDTMITGPVGIEDYLTVTATYDPTNRWNGWIMSPLVTREEAEKIVAFLTEDDSSLRFEGDTLVYTSYAGTEYEAVDRVEPNEAGLYDVGFGWVWFEQEEVPPPGSTAMPKEQG